MSDNLENIKAILFDNTGTITTWATGETREDWPRLMPKLSQNYIVAIVSMGKEITESWLKEIGLDPANSHDYMMSYKDEVAFVLRQYCQNIAQPSMYMFLEVNKTNPDIYPMIAKKIGVEVSEMLLIDDGLHKETEETNSNVKGATEAGAHGMHYSGSVNQLENKFRENHLRF